MTRWCTRIACWVPNATNTHSEYVTLIALPLQQCLHERASVLCYTYIACLFVFKVTAIKANRIIRVCDALTAVFLKTEVPLDIIQCRLISSSIFRVKNPTELDS